MPESNSAAALQKTCTFWSQRRERLISLRICYHFHEQDGCRIYTLQQVDELGVMPWY